MSFDEEFDFLFGGEHGIEPVVDAWGDLSYDYDHVNEGVALLLEQFTSSDNLQMLVAVLMNQAQDAEGVAWQLLTERCIDYAAGDQLDGLGAVVGESRDGREDEVYRTAIRVRVAVNRSNGRIDELINILGLVFGSNLDAWVREEHPAAMTLDLRNPAVTPNTPNALIGFLRDAKAGGVRLDLVYSIDDADNTLTWDDYEGQPISGAGLDGYEGQDVDAGVFAGVIW